MLHCQIGRDRVDIGDPEGAAVEFESRAAAIRRFVLVGDLVSFLDLILEIISLPFQMIRELVFGIGNLVVFDILGLGPFLPITL